VAHGFWSDWCSSFFLRVHYLQHLYRRLGGAIYGAVLGNVLQGRPRACAVPAVHGRWIVFRRDRCSSRYRDVGVVLRPVAVIVRSRGARDRISPRPFFIKKYRTLLAG